MIMSKRATQRACHAGLAMALATAGLTSLVAQDTARQIWDDAFRRQRPAAPAAARPAPEHIRYRPATPHVAAPTPETRVVGLTVWRLRPAGVRDRDVPRLLVQEPAGPAPYVPERVEGDEPLQFGDRLRLGIEVSQKGHLYVVNRERFDDGSVGPPYLIFPAVNLRGGDNRVEPGRLIEIPSREDPVPALVSQRSSNRHVGEELLIVVTPAPIAGIVPDRRIQELSSTLVAEWERTWGGTPARLDLATPQRPWTASEHAAGAGPQLLTQSDPMPQTLFRTQARGGNVLVRVPIAMR
jgi:hypothetical protein